MVLLADWVAKYNRERGVHRDRGGKKQKALTYLRLRTGLTEATLRRILRGGRPSMDSAVRLVAATDGEVSLTELAGGESAEDDAA